MIVIVQVKWRTAETHVPSLIELRPELLRVEFRGSRRAGACGRRICVRPRGKGVTAPVVFVVVIIFMIRWSLSRDGLFPSIAESFPGKAGRNLHKGKDEKVKNRARATANGRAICCKARRAAADLASAPYAVLFTITYIVAAAAAVLVLDLVLVRRTLL